jgi:hypothetical protein
VHGIVEATKRGVPVRNRVCDPAMRVSVGDFV